MIIIFVIIALVLAINMGVSGFTVSFAPSYGSNIISHKRAVFLYTGCVLLGGVLIGVRVVDTLVNKLSSFNSHPLSGGIIILSCTITIALSNLLKVPQSTSFVTVASFVGAGLYSAGVNWYVVGKIIFFAFFLSLASLLLTIAIKRKFYPPHSKNIKFYENFFIHRQKLKSFIIFQNIYAAFAIGTNNVANVVAPLLRVAPLNIYQAFFVVAVFFGLGAFLYGGKMIHSVSREIIPLGEFSATLISSITATLVIIASFLGLPTPYVQLSLFSLIGVSCVKDGLKCTIEKNIIKKMFWVWIIIPVFTVFLTYFLNRIILK